MQELSGHLEGSMRRFIILSIVLVLLQQNQASSGGTEAADRGYRLLTETAFLTSDFDQATFDEVWQKLARTAAVGG